MKRAGRKNKRISDPEQQAVISNLVPEMPSDRAASRSAAVVQEELEEGTLFEESAIADAYVRMYRRDEKTAAWVMHGRFPPEEATAEKVAELFGGGRYRAQLCIPDAERTGRIRTVRTREFILPGLYRAPRDVYGISPNDMHSGLIANRPGASALGAHEVGTGTPPTTREALDTAILSQVLDLMRQTRDTRPATDWGPIITAGLGFLGSLATKMLERSDHPTGDVLAKLETLRVELEQLKTRPGPTTNAISDALGGIERIVSVSRKVKTLMGDGENADPEAAMWGLARSALETMQKGQQPVSSALPPSQPAPIQQQPPLWQRVLLRHGRDLLQAAVRGVDPGLAAEWMAATIPSEVEGVVLEFLQRPDAADVLMQVVPDLAQFPDYVRRFLAAAQREMLTPDPDADEESEPPDD